MYLSIIIPAYNEEQRIGKTLHAILAYTVQQSYPAEIIVVDDGSDDNTAQMVMSCGNQIVPVQLLQNGENRGKGFSVRRGFFQARGEYLLFSDADLSTPIDEVEKLLANLQEPCDIAIGSRALPESRIEAHQPRYREYIGRFFNVLVRALAVRGIRDTQCGFKCFGRQAALAICQRMRCERFGFDVEMLYLARRLGYYVHEVPVIWRHSPQTRVRMLADSFSMLRDLVGIRWNDVRARYDLPGQRGDSASMKQSCGDERTTAPSLLTDVDDHAARR